MNVSLLQRNGNGGLIILIIQVIIHLSILSNKMKYKFKAAILEKLNSPLKIDYISFDGKLLKGQSISKNTLFWNLCFTTWRNSGY